MLALYLHRGTYVPTLVNVRSIENFDVDAVLRMKTVYSLYAFTRTSLTCHTHINLDLAGIDKAEIAKVNDWPGFPCRRSCESGLPAFPIGDS